MKRRITASPRSSRRHQSARPSLIPRKLGGAHRKSGKRCVHFEFIHPLARRVCLAGTFNNWKPETAEMTRTPKGKWVKDLELFPGTYEYRLVVDGIWMPDPGADHAVMNPFGERNSLLTVP